MAEAHWTRHALSVGRTEFRRTLRAIRADTARAVLLGLGVVGSGVFVLGLAVLLALGLRETAGPVPVPDAVGGSVALFWLFGVFIVAQRTLNQHNRIDAESLLLTAVSPRTVATGLLLAETLRALTYVLIPGVAVTAVVVYGFASPISLLVVPVAVVCLLVSTVVAGGLLGFTGALFVARYRFVARYKSVLGVLVVVATMGPYIALQTNLVEGVSPALLAWLPAAWFVHLGAVGTPAEASPLLAAGSLLATLALLGPGGVLLVRVAETYWYADPVDPSRDDENGSTTVVDGNALAATLGRFDLPAWVARPSLAVARKAVVRTRRNPNRLSFVLLPVLIGVVQLISVSQTTGSLGYLPPFAALGAAWVAGASFGLNPLGDEGNVLPVTLTSGIRARTFVTGVVYPGALFGVPLAVLTPIAAGIAAGAPPLDVAGVVALAVALTLFALPLGPAVGMRFPRFSALRAGRSREVIPPTLTTAAIYSVPLVLLSVFGAASLLVPEIFAAAIEFVVGGSVPPPAVVAVGYGGTLVVCLVGGWLAFRDAMSTFADYRVA